MTFLRSFLITLFAAAALLHVLLPLPSETAVAHLRGAPDSAPDTAQTAVAPVTPAAVQPVTLAPKVRYDARIFEGPLTLTTTDFTYDAPQNIARSFSFTQTTQTGTELRRQWFGHGMTFGKPRATVILLHGAGRNGLSMIDMWRSTAEREQLVLLAPNSSLASDWSLIDDGADFLKQLLTEAAAHYPIDQQNVYLMGHSAGGVLASYVANHSNGPWKAVATHAGSMPADWVRPAPEGIPLIAYIGDQDQSVPLAEVTATARALAQAGHPVTQFTIPGHSHWYYEIGPQIAPYMWQQMATLGGQ
ncbi:prolyl oligopeptidase family serine peptidase [Cognatishimia sp. SS12]|uniref:alpha/beta hydrolase family esterase n=1 Tax=Cognatishimia sp. SS12 TaxID=2979465 RepID=UPI00232B9396|nr:prolyl oligopeptidase family serine peptidase [Cognatishimia sp. SS12]MDC0737540.1 prolyl oligopeptidase family serine peptidase [Cognatishimia sp. SS12]